MLTKKKKVKWNRIEKTLKMNVVNWKIKQNQIKNTCTKIYQFSIAFPKVFN